MEPVHGYSLGDDLVPSSYSLPCPMESISGFLPKDHKICETVNWWYHFFCISVILKPN